MDPIERMFWVASHPPLWQKVHAILGGAKFMLWDRQELEVAESRPVHDIYGWETGEVEYGGTRTYHRDQANVLLTDKGGTFARALWIAYPMFEFVVWIDRPGGM